MTKFFDAFISYGRADSREFAVKLQSSLSKHGLEVWFDFNDIPLGVDFQNQIDDGIEKADNFLFIISPHSINSPYCGKEIDLAIKCNKRIIPLLHVDEISWETWQQRNPNGSLQDWEAYKAQGKHTSFVNMHPSIGKINWVYFQEGKNDFDNSLEDLINLLGLHKDYVQQHTRFLNKALEWERNQKQTSYLLVGEEKQLAQNWLKIRFCEEQPPCIPSDLHCEYITESIKNGNNLMTQVFLSYAEEDRATMEKIRASLRREGITVWTNTTDIHTGEDFVNSIKRGIEFADNLVYLLSPDSIKSNYTQQELDLAVEFNKRIIPLQVQKTDNLELPSALQDLQYIDLTDNQSVADYQLDESELLKILYEDAAYYNEHKILLTKALKWKQQNHNPSILLRGYNLHSAKTWLEVAQKRTQHPPIPLQSEFITASLQQPPLESLDVFISYSRADSDLARKLNDALQVQGKTTWFDQESIASGSDFQQEINRGIKASDNFVFIISERSVNSPYCKDEVEYAASLNKRFVTVLHQQVNTSDLHPELAKVQWIDFNSNKQDFNANFNQLLRTIETDREHVHNHSKWLQRALEWEQKNKNDDLLLRGSNLIIAQNWLEETEDKKKKPAITVLQKEFIQASQKAVELAEEEEKRRQERMLRLQEEKIAEQKKSAKKQKFFLGVVSIAFLVAVVFYVRAYLAERTVQKALETQIYSASRISLFLFQQNLKFDALIEAIRAGKPIQEGLSASQKTRSLVLTALQTAVYEDGFREQNRLKGHKNEVIDVAWSRNGKQIATASQNGIIRIWNKNGKIINSIPVGDKNAITSLIFSPDGKTLASIINNNIVRLWNVNNGNKIETIKVGDNSTVQSISFSHDGETIASAYADDTVRLWNINNGNKIETIKVGNNSKSTSASFSPDGKILASIIDANTVRLWNVNNRNIVRTIELNDEYPFRKISFSSDGNNIVTTNLEDTVKVWSKEGIRLKTIKNNANESVFPNSIHGNTIATFNYSTVKISDKQKKQTLKGHNFLGIQFSPDGKTIATVSDDNTVILWGKSDKKLKKLKESSGHLVSNLDRKTIAFLRKDNTIKVWTNKGEWKFIPDKIKFEDRYYGISFSPDGNTIASASRDNTVKLWNKEGKKLTTLEGHTEAVKNVAWSPNGNYIASSSEDNTVKLWTKEGKKLKTLEGDTKAVTGVAWSPDGNTIASGSRDNTIKLWDKQGNFIRDMGKHDDSVVSVAWSPDGNIIASGSNDNSVKLWNKEEGKPKILKGHKNHVLSVAFSPDGNTIATASRDGSVKFWSKDGQELQTLYGHNGGVASVRFSSDGKTLASNDFNGTVIVWNLEDLTLDKLMQNACAQVKNYLEHNATGSDRELCK